MQLEKPVSSVLFEDAKYDVEEILGLVAPDIRQLLDMTEVILRIVDGSRVSQFKPRFGQGILTVWAHIHGRSYSFHFEFLI